MGRIKKAGGPKHDATLAPAFSTFIEHAVRVPLSDLPAYLSTFPSRWPFPRGDLYHWIPLLNRFDAILEVFNDEYGLKDGPQTQPFARRMLQTEHEAQSTKPATDEDLNRLGFAPDGDRELVEAVLAFSRLLLQNCGNRSLYSSSEHLNHLLHSISSSLLRLTLRLAVCLAQRYHASRHRTVGSVQQLNMALLATHYNISLDRVQQLAIPFVRSAVPAEPTTSPVSPLPNRASKDRAESTDPMGGVSPVNANDLTALVRAPSSHETDPPISGDEVRLGSSGQDVSHPDWKVWGDVVVTYYAPGPVEPVSPESKRPALSSPGGPHSDAPHTTAVATTHGKGPEQWQPSSRRKLPPSSGHAHGQTSGRASNAPDPADLVDERHVGSMRVLTVTSDTLVSTPVWKIMAAVAPEVPPEARFELLCRLRVASALVDTSASRQEILAIRIAAITNLAYIYPEHTFQHKVLQQDTDEPRRLQLIHQLAELVRPSEDGVPHPPPRWLQTLSFAALEALAKLRSRATDVSNALNANVNHGVLFYVLRRVIAEMRAGGDHEGDPPEDDEWREALFSLVSYLPNITRTGGASLSHGLLPLVLEVLTLRSPRAERVQAKVIDFLHVFVYVARDPFQTLATAGGLDVFSALVAYEVESGYDRAQRGQGVPGPYRNQLVDYEMPFFQHQTLRRLFKFINHMMSSNGLTLDRLLRNLIDSPPLLSGLRLVIANANVFGSNVWSGAVDVMSNFIHNEPTSYAVVAEAGLCKTLVEVVSGEPIPTEPDPTPSEPSHDGPADGDHHGEVPSAPDADSAEGDRRDEHEPSTLPDEEGSATPTDHRRRRHHGLLASGILPAVDAIAVVPHAFGAICLNTVGMKLFQRSTALASFFEIFQSAEHVRRMDVDADLPSMLGSSIDELVRHHPALKDDVVNSIMTMVKMVGQVCRERAHHDGSATKSADADDPDHHPSASTTLIPGQASVRGDGAGDPVRPNPSGQPTDVEMREADAEPERASTPPPTATLNPSNQATSGEPGLSNATWIEVMAKFLTGFLSNQAACTSFIDRGGPEWLLDLAEIPGLAYDFSHRSAGQSLARVMHMLVEQKPHLILPSLVRRTQKAVDELAAFSRHDDVRAFFHPLVGRAPMDGQPDQVDAGVVQGRHSPWTAKEHAKSLATATVLGDVMLSVFSQPMLSHRSSHTLFSQVNLADMYMQLIESLDRLFHRCLIEDIALQKEVPSAWKDVPRTKGFGSGSSANADEIIGILQSYRALPPVAETLPSSSDGEAAVAAEPSLFSTNQAPMVAGTTDAGTSDEAFRKTAQFQNFQALRHIIRHISLTVISFFHELGKTLVTKRLSDPHQKHNAAMVAQTIADTVIKHLNVDLSTVLDRDDQDSYQLNVLNTVSRLTFEGSLDRHPTRCLTLVLQAFKNRGGFDALRRVLDRLVNQTQIYRAEDDVNTSKRAMFEHGVQAILTFFQQVVTPKNILESTQTTALASRDRSRDKPDYFSPNQFLIELKLSVLPPVQSLWESPFIEQASTLTVKRMVEIMRIILENDGEQGASKRSDAVPRRVRVPLKPWKAAPDRLERLVNAGHREDLAEEALYRCHDNAGLAEDYCALIERCDRVGQNPIFRRSGDSSGSNLEPDPLPELRASNDSGTTGPEDRDVSAPSPEGISAVTDEQPSPDDRQTMEVDVPEGDAQPESTGTGPPETSRLNSDELPEEGGALLTMSIDHLLGNLTNLEVPTTAQSDTPAATNGDGDVPMTTPQAEANAPTNMPTLTVDDLDERRKEIRWKIIELALDVLNVHGDVTFELADLITAAVPKSGVVDFIRTEIGETLVKSLMSLQMEDDFRPVGKKIAAYAHLLALVVHEKKFYEATLKELKASLPALLGFIKVFPDQTLEDSSPWISQILLVMENLLSDDARPRPIKWTPPTTGSTETTGSIAELEEPIVADEHKGILLDAILEILPRVGKDASLALSILRVLVILSRNRQLAIRLGEKRNLQRLFVMIKQLAGMTTSNLQSAFMIVLRHIIEDDDTVKQIMRTGIQRFFESRSSSRQADINSYVRSLSHLVLRAPDLFVTVTNEMVKIPKFDEAQRYQTLALKEVNKAAQEGENTVEAEGGEQDGVASAAGIAHDDASRSPGKRTRQVVRAPEEPSPPKQPPSDVKFLPVEHPDGVIHYLLCELLSYREVDDKETSTSARTAAGTSADRSSTDVTMVDREGGSIVSTNVSSLPQHDQRPDSSASPGFKAEQHPIFIYRCFILQCLSELLSSYTRTKLEFISFTRKAAPQTPSTKPRSGILNYFFNGLIPIGTLNQPEDVAFRKKLSTSNWATTVIVSLCSKTTEKHAGRDQPSWDDVDEPELTPVRKFVLEHAQKAYREATASTDNLDVKYAKILSLADLFSRMLFGSPGSASGENDTGPLYPSKSLSKLMLTYNFISALTASLAEIDLNFPSAKRAVKYILRPLKSLTQSAVELSESSDLSSLMDPSEEDGVRSASSVSELDGGREETPDLFRNSTLGMFEPGREADSSHGSSEDGQDELYDDEYADEMEYEEDATDGETGITDDEGMSDVEGLPGDVGLDVEVVLDGDDEDDADSDLNDADSDDVDESDNIHNVDGGRGGFHADDEDENGEWESDDDDVEDGDEDDDDEDDDDHPHLEVEEIIEQVEAASHMHPHHVHDHDNPLEHMVRALSGDDEADMLQQLQEDMELDPEGFIDDDMQEDEEVSDEDDDEDDLEDDDEAIYGTNYDDVPNLRWGWSPEGDQPMAPRGHSGHLAPHHRLPNPWSIFTGTNRDPGLLVPTYRSHRSVGSHPRSNDDGTHPLLQRNPDTLPSSAVGREEGEELMSDWIHALELGGRGRGLLSADIPASLIQNLISVIGHSGATLGGVHRHGGALHFHVSGPPPRTHHRDGVSPLGMRTSHVVSVPPSPNPDQAIAFTPMITSGRWQGEARLLFGPEISDQAQQVINKLLSIMVPPAREEERLDKERVAAEEARKAQEEKEKEKERQVENDRVTQRKREEEEQEQQRRAAERDAALTDANDEASDVPHDNQEDGEDAEAAERDSVREASIENDSMEGVEAAQPETIAVAGEPGPAISTPRVHTTIRGRELDITGMDIDPEYLDALPEELREEVLMHQIAERRSQATTSGEPPTNISREFLEALPADIREELLEQEAQDRRRREREEARRRAAATDGSNQAAAEDMDPASVLATLEPSLRQAILMEQDEDVLAHLPQDIAAEARALGGDHRLRHQFTDPGRLNRGQDPNQNQGRQELSIKKSPQRRVVVQMLDKAGIATLVRLMFIQQGSARHALNGILQNICENKQNRLETVSLLLSILQDGSADAAAIDRTFAQLTIRARQTGGHKSIQTPKRSHDQLPHGVCEITPLAVVQQCLNSLVLLVQSSPHLQSFFLTEHNGGMVLRRLSSKKGKARENRASRYPLNSLLSLLDRKLVMESPTVMEQLSTLLNCVTQPLNALLRKEKGPDVEDPPSDTAARDLLGSEAPAGGATAPDSTQNQQHALEDAARTEHQAQENQSMSQDQSGQPAVDPVTSTSEPTGANPSADDAKAKKEHSLEPPVIPDANLRLVVNILTARECSAKTFRDTLSSINSLSAIPGSKDVFRAELLRQARSLGEAILSDLRDLIEQINKAQTDTDVHGLALTKFSPSSSSQAKLLRVLMALDYIFDPFKSNRKRNQNAATPSVDEDLISTLSNDATFGPLWVKLSECLNVIRQKEHIMMNFATILLPLIESLMVVCKNAALDSPIVQRPPGPEKLVSALANDDGLDELFFRFTEEHRKVMNELVRHNPKLMSGTFSLLVRNPKVLEFDNKRNYFNRRLHLRTETRHTQTPLQLSVRREYVFLDSFKSLYFKSGDEMKYGKLSIRFHGEEGVDAGGVTREWFQVLSRQMFNPDYALFTPVAADRTTFHPNRLSAVNPEHFMFFKFIGRIIGKALYEGRVLDCHFSRAVYKRILRKPLSVKDMETLDLDYYKSLVWMLENDITDIITETFSVESEAFGQTEIIDLKANGRNIPVTEQNKQEYVRLVVEYRLTGSVQEQLEHFLSGFHDIVPAELVSIFDEQELELLISGLPDIDVDDWKNNTEYHNYMTSTPQIQWFWRAVRSFDKEERAKLLQFVTGTSKVPLNGFKELEGMNGFSRFSIHRDYGSKDRLPSSHTCFNQLDLPEYDSYESLRTHVYTAMTAGSEYFGFA